VGPWRDWGRAYIGKAPMRKNRFRTAHMRTKNPRALLYPTVSSPYAALTPNRGVMIAPNPP
jgi:hypothetical protein